MPLKIAILEDNLERQQAMRAWLSDRLYMYEHKFFDEAAPMIEWLTANMRDVLFVSLDHDLDLKPTGDGRWYDPGTGRMVANYLAECAPIFPCIIHSTNRDAVIGMEALLRERGWNVDVVQPYGDLAWIDESWWPAARRQMHTASANSELPPASSVRVG